MAFPKTHLSDVEGGDPYCHNPRAAYIWQIPQNGVAKFITDLKADSGNYCEKCIKKMATKTVQEGLMAAEMLRDKRRGYARANRP